MSPTRHAMHGGASLRLTFALAVAAGGLAVWLHRVGWNGPFPKSHNARPAAGPHTTTATLSPKALRESIPGHRVGEPRLAPGLDAFAGYAPTLNAALTTIVFACEEGEGKDRNLDLFLATCDKPLDAFRRPVRLAACSTSGDETDPTLSPDGSELIFVRTTDSVGSQLLRSVRESPTGGFAEPRPIAIPKMPAGDGVRKDSPQVVRDGGELIFRVTRNARGRSTPSYFVAWRESPEGPCGRAEPLPVFVEQARHFLTGGGLRAFVARYDTIQLCCRPSLDAPFSAPGKLDALNATRIGFAEGPIWISPAEDFLFYCVTAADRAQQRRRYLWQVWFR